MTIATHSNTKKILRVFDLLCGVSFVLEMVIYPSVENLYVCSCLALGWVVIRIFSLTEKNFIYFPASFLMMFGLGVFYYLLPAPLTLFDGRPVSYNLRMPIETLSHHLLFAATVVATHYLYVTISAGRNFFREVLVYTPFYEQPSNAEIWATALLGLISSAYMYFILGSWQVESSERGFEYHIASIFGQYVWMPIVLLFPKLRGLNFGVSAKQHRQIIVYSIVLVFVAIASNWRTILYSGIIFFGILSFLSWLRGDFEIRRIISAGSLIVGAIIVYIVTGPLIDFGYAMVVVRGTRSNVTAYELLTETMRVYFDGSEIEAAKQETSKAHGSNGSSLYVWDEEYLSNAIENRFVNLKISDNCLFYAKEIGVPNEEMQAEFGRQIVSMAPTVLLNLFGISPEKKFSVSYSIGDYLYSMAVNDSSVLGSAIISAMPGVGMSIFGYFYPIVIVGLFFVIFFMFDSMVVFVGCRSYYSYLFFLNATIILNYFNDRHVYFFEFRYILRTYWESVIVFLFTMAMVRSLLKVFGLNDGRKFNHQ